MRLSTWLGRLLIAIGCVCLAAAGASLLTAASFQRTAAQAFDRELLAPAPPELADTVAAAPEPSASRPSALYTRPSAGLSGNGSASTVHGLIGRLEIPRLNVSVMVMEGDDDATLARAAGHLPETALPWERGNAVIAAHRDTFFRPLKNIREGDAIRMTTTRGTFEYRVTGTEIVEPDDLSVLAPTTVPALTLVTCYPFSYVGAAPQRFIIHAR
jgi:sortase A